MSSRRSERIKVCGKCEVSVSGGNIVCPYCGGVILSVRDYLLLAPAPRGAEDA